jgi:hypothetical protein
LKSEIDLGLRNKNMHIMNCNLLKSFKFLQKIGCYRRPRDDEEVVPEVYPVDDVAGWTHVMSSFMGHRNIYKSQRTIIISVTIR